MIACMRQDRQAMGGSCTFIVASVLDTCSANIARIAVAVLPGPVTSQKSRNSALFVARYVSVASSEHWNTTSPNRHATHRVLAHGAGK